MDFLVRARFLVSQATLSRKNGPSGNGVSVPAVPFAWRSRGSSTFGIATWLGLFAPSMKNQSGGSTLNSFRSETLRRATAFKFLVALGQFDWIN
jgi:hypothetical protein